MDRLTRKELKTDKFATEVGQTVEFLEEHRKQAFIVGGAIVAILLLITGYYYYQKGAHTERQVALKEALRTFDGVVGPGAPAFIRSFASEAEKHEAVLKDFNAVIEKYPGSEEAHIATFYLGVQALADNNAAEAEKYFKQVVDSGDQIYGSQAKYSLAQLYGGQGKIDEAEKLLQELIDKPTILVSKEQATITLARLLATKNPAKARELLEPLRTERSAVGRSAITALSEIPAGEQ